MHEITLLQDLAIVMAVSAVITVLFHRLHLPVVLGYILAGMIIGPHTPPFPLITDFHSIHTLSELGIVFLLFAIGLEFSFSKLAKVGFVAFFAATVEIVLMMGMGYALGRAFGWKFMDSLFLGAILAISSTTIIVKVLMEMKKVQEKFAQVILGILIIEDLLAIVIIAILSGLAISGELTLQTAGQAMLQVMAFVAGVLFFGFLLIPRLLRYLDKLQIPEMFIVSILGLCFTGALLASRMGFSVALGAFLIGAIIAETKQGEKVVHHIEPIKDMFTAVFFVSVGMLIQPQVLIQYGIPILIITLVTIAGKVFSCSLATFLTGYKSDVALKVGLGLAQIGEFSFIIARLGESTEVTSPFLYPIAVSVSGVTTLTTPFLMRNTGVIINGFKKIAPQPVETFLGFYTSWVQSFGSADQRSEKRKHLDQSLKYVIPRLFFYIFSGLIFFYGFSFFNTQSKLFDAWTYGMILAGGIFPLLMGLIYTIDRFFCRILFLNTAIQALVRFALVWVAIVIMAPLLWHLIPSGPFIFGILLIAGISGFMLWGSMSKLHDKLEDTVLGVFDRDTSSSNQPEEKQTHDELARLIREEYPWEVETLDFLVPLKECALNQRIRDLKMRGVTGASIVAVYRDTEAIPNPSPDTKIMPGDVLLLMGDKTQIVAAVEFLKKQIKEPMPGIRREGSPQTQSFKVPAHSFAAGKTVQELRLRRKTGATILGIQKDNQTLNNPSGDVLVEKGDVLILFGWPDETEAAVQYLAHKSAGQA